MTDEKETFDLRVNSQPLSAHSYLDFGFKLVDDEVHVCHAWIRLNGRKVINEAFENSHGFLSHKVLDVVGDEPVDDLLILYLEATTSVVNEVMSALIRLVDGKTGLKKLTLGDFIKKM